MSKHLVRVLLLAIIGAVILSVSYSLAAQQQLKSLTAITIKVGAGIRPPFLIDQQQGMGPEILNVLNLIQDKFYFELVPTPISRRVQSLHDGWVDIVMWDNIHWGWQNLDVKLAVSSNLLHTKDVFITYASAGKIQRYFDNFSGKRICGVNGYHYKFVNYQTNIRELRKLYDMTLVRTEEESIKMALQQRCEISVVSESALAWFFTLHSQYSDKIMISEKFDTQYSRSFLLPSYAAISAQELNDILAKANRLHLLDPIYKKYGQVNPLTVAAE